MDEMKKFLLKVVVFGVISFAAIEMFSRIVIDPIYFFKLDTFEEKNKISLKAIYSGKETTHVDFLFLGSSRIPASINPQLVKTLSGGKIAVNGGRGNMTPGIMFQALVQKEKEHPGYLKGATVALEYAGYEELVSSFDEIKLALYEPNEVSDRLNPHIIIPYLDRTSFIEYLKTESNKPSTKAKVALCYISSLYRTSYFVNEEFNKLNGSLFDRKQSKLNSSGGIQELNINNSISKAQVHAELLKKKINRINDINERDLKDSFINKLHGFIKKHEGRLILFEVPLHSIQSEIYSSRKATRNELAFFNWLRKQEIELISVPEFDYTDEDFPDFWHLSKNRTDEFTRLLFEHIQ